MKIDMKCDGQNEASTNTSGRVSVCIHVPKIMIALYLLQSLASVSAFSTTATGTCTHASAKGQRIPSSNEVSVNRNKSFRLFSPFALTSTSTSSNKRTSTRLFASNKKSKINRDNSGNKETDTAANDNSSNKYLPPIERPTNEFSRTYRIDAILSGGYRQRDYNVDVQASDEELKQLATRFELRNIYSLQAQLALRRDRASPKGVEVEGEVNARLSQVCVRTGDVFDVDVQFPLFAVVRPMFASLGDVGQEGDEDVPQAVVDYQQKANKKERVKTPNLKDMDMSELQNLLQDFDVEDDIMEDEAIYSNNGKLDVGELVAQLFWLKLDPYPKKPGSDPVSSSISG